MSGQTRSRRASSAVKSGRHCSVASAIRLSSPQNEESVEHTEEAHASRNLANVAVDLQPRGFIRLLGRCAFTVFCRNGRHRELPGRALMRAAESTNGSGSRAARRARGHARRARHSVAAGPTGQRTARVRAPAVEAPAICPTRRTDEREEGLPPVVSSVAAALLPATCLSSPRAGVSSLRTRGWEELPGGIPRAARRRTDNEPLRERQSCLDQTIRNTMPTARSRGDGAPPPGTRCDSVTSAEVTCSKRRRRSVRSTNSRFSHVG